MQYLQQPLIFFFINNNPCSLYAYGLHYIFTVHLSIYMYHRIVQYVVSTVLLQILYTILSYSIFTVDTTILSYRTPMGYTTYSLYTYAYTCTIGQYSMQYLHIYRVLLYIGFYYNHIGYYLVQYVVSTYIQGSIIYRVLLYISYSILSSTPFHIHVPQDSIVCRIYSKYVSYIQGSIIYISYRIVYYLVSTAYIRYIQASIIHISYIVFSICSKYVQASIQSEGYPKKKYVHIFFWVSFAL